MHILLEPNENNDQSNVFCFTSFKSIISKCSKNMKEKSPEKTRTRNSKCIMQHCKRCCNCTALHDFQLPTKQNYSRLKPHDNQCTNQYKIENSDTGSISSQINDEESNYKVIIPTKYLSDKEYDSKNSSRTSYDDQITKESYSKLKLHDNQYTNQCKSIENANIVSTTSQINDEEPNYKVIIPTKYVSDKEYNSTHSSRTSYDNQVTTQNYSKSKPHDNQYTNQYKFIEDTDTTTVVGQIKNKDLNYKVIVPTKYLSDKEYNSRYSPCISYNNQIIKIKRNAGCQTSEKCKSYHTYKKSKKKIESSKKRSIAYFSTSIPSSKDIKTIFETNRKNFNNGKSRTNLELLETQYIKEITKNKNKKIDKKLKKYDKENLIRKKKKSHISNNKENIFKFKNEKEISTREKELKNEKMLKNIESNIDSEIFFDCNSMPNLTDDNLTKIFREYNDRNERLMLDENGDYVFQERLINDIKNNTNVSTMTAYNDTTNFSNSKNCTKNKEKIMLDNCDAIKLNEPSSEMNTSWRSQTYLIENKTSELMILGNVKKRLEEDYDDYFSLYEMDDDTHDLDNDLFLDAKNSNDILEIDKPCIEIKADYHASQDNLKTLKQSMLTASIKKNQEMKEVTQQSIRTLICPCSICFLNSNLNNKQNSIYTALKERECSSSSSIEYCSASNIPLSKKSTQNSSFNTIFQTHSMDTTVLYDDDLKKSEIQNNCFLNDISYEDDNTLHDTREFFDRTLLNSYMMCCCQRNSTPNFSKSKLVTESLDSGILTDFSRDQLRIISDEQFCEKSEKKNRGERKCYTKKVDLLPTFDFNTDSSYSDDSLNRRVDLVVKKFTENLILTERKARIKLRRMENSTKRKQIKKQWKNRRQVRLEIILKQIRKNLGKQINVI